MHRDSQLFNDAMDQIAALEFSTSAALIWDMTPTLFLATNTEDSWFAAVYAIGRQVHQEWSHFSTFWYRAPVVNVELGLNGQSTSIRLFGIERRTHRPRP